MCLWLDTNIDLNQQRLESVTTRLALVVTLGLANLGLMAASVESKAWPLTAIASVVTVIALALAGLGLKPIVGNDRDPTTTWETLWKRRVAGEVLAVLYQRRSVVYLDQRKAIDYRAESLQSSSWTAGFGALVAGAAILVSRI